MVLIIILRYRSVSNQHIIHLKLTQRCMSVYLSKAGKEAAECVTGLVHGSVRWVKWEQERSGVE